MTGVPRDDAGRPPLRPLRGRRRPAPVLGRLRAGLDGGRRGADPRPAAGRVPYRPGRGRPPAGCSRARAPGAAGRQAGAQRDRHRPRRRSRSCRSGSTTPRRSVGDLTGRTRAGGRRRLDGRARRGDPAPPRRRADPGRQPHARARAARGAAASAARRCPLRPADRGAERGRPGRHRDRRGRHRGAQPTPSLPALDGRDGRPLVFLDLALPHDVEPAVADLPGVRRDRPRGAALPCSSRRRSPRTSRRCAQIVADEVATLPDLAARGRGRADRRRAARAGRGGRRGRAAAAGRPGRPRRADRRPRWPRPCAGWSTRCCTRRPCG